MPKGIYTRVETEERFWAKVRILESGCWQWNGCINTNGYGRFVVDKVNMPVRRFAYEHLTNTIKEGK